VSVYVFSLVLVFVFGVDLRCDCVCVSDFALLASHLLCIFSFHYFLCLSVLPLSPVAVIVLTTSVFFRWTIILHSAAFVRIGQRPSLRYFNFCLGRVRLIYVATVAKDVLLACYSAISSLLLAFFTLHKA
jgi:hypothetical protein